MVELIVGQVLIIMPVYFIGVRVGGHIQRKRNDIFLRIVRDTVQKQTAHEPKGDLVIFCFDTIREALNKNG